MNIYFWKNVKIRKTKKLANAKILTNSYSLLFDRVKLIFIHGEYINLKIIWGKK